MLQTIKKWFATVMVWGEALFALYNNLMAAGGAIAILIALLAIDFSNDQPQEVGLTDVNAWLFVALVIALGFAIYYVRRNYAEGFQTAGGVWNEIFVVVGFLFALISIIATLPIIIGTSARYFGIVILNCSHPRMVDYAWFVLDNVAKGTLLDFIESFHLDLYDQACPPSRDSRITSCIMFAIRTFSTYILVWFILRIWGSLRSRLIAPF